MPTTPPSITTLPAAPDPNNRTTFNSLAYPWSAALPTFGTEVSAVGANVKANADEAEADAIATAADRVVTTADRIAAAASAATATTQAGNALTSANNAAASAAVASGAAAFVDTNPVVKGSSDATKQVRFEVDGLTTGTTRVLTVPDADMTLVGAATTQTLTNKTLTGYTETVYNLAGTDIAVANGTIQTKTLAANTTFTESLADGQSVVLMLNPVTYTTTWPTTSWVNAAGSAAAPTLKASVVNVVVLWQVAGTLYGNWVGSM